MYSLRCIHSSENNFHRCNHSCLIAIGEKDFHLEVNTLTGIHFPTHITGQIHFETGDENDNEDENTISTLIPVNTFKSKQFGK